jgi:hypothetical protein
MQDFVGTNMALEIALSLVKELLAAGGNAAAVAVVSIGREKAVSKGIDDVDTQKLVRAEIKQVLQGIEMLRSKELKAAKLFLRNAIQHGQASIEQDNFDNFEQEKLWATYLDQAHIKSIEAFGVVSTAEQKLEASTIRIAAVILRYMGNSRLLSTEIELALEALTTDQLVQRELVSELNKWFTNTRRENLLRTIGLQYCLLLRELDPETRSKIPELRITCKNWRGVEFTSDCARLLLCGAPHSQKIEGHTDSVSCVVQLADGRMVSGSLDSTLRLWDIESGVCVKTLAGHTDSVYCVVQLADGRVVSGSRDKTLRLWDI